ncbi:MAG: NAD(P)H-binding protein [Verrucomicrobiaceae bacterium]|nr:NAD(P)H-binding protein [Verrucomicrobiaceae bacterium]
MFRIFLLILIPYALVLSALLWRRAPIDRPGKQATRQLPDPMRVLVLGATGGTGRELVQQALAQRHQVTAFVRDPARLQIEHANLRVAKGDVLDYATVESAMRGQDAVLSALGHRRFFYPNRIQSEGMRNVLRAMKTCDVPRLICETALGIGNSVGRLGLQSDSFFGRAAAIFAGPFRRARGGGTGSAQCAPRFADSRHDANQGRLLRPTPDQGESASGGTNRRRRVWQRSGTDSRGLPSIEKSERAASGSERRLR